MLDLGNTTTVVPVLSLAIGVGNTVASGELVSRFADMKNTGGLCNLVVVGGPTSGPIAIQVQCADAISGVIMSGGVPPSGTFTDPTSGLAQFPSTFISGGIVWFNSGLYSLPGGGNVSGTNGLGLFPAGLNPVFAAQGSLGYTVSGTFPAFASGGAGCASFQRTGRFVRCIALSGAFTADAKIMFVEQLMTTGSGGGFHPSPGSGAVSV